MDRKDTLIDRRAVVGRNGLDALIATLRGEGYAVIGPQARDGTIVYDPIDSTADLPIGLADDQDGGRYRLVEGAPGALFGTTVGPHTWKRYLYPPRQALWSATADGAEGGFAVTVPDTAAPRYAFFGVRPCELKAMAVQDRVFGAAPDAAGRPADYTDRGYAARRAAAFIVAVNCGRPGGTCFCVSMDGGPKAEAGYDLAVTELLGDGRHDFLVEAGSERGAAVLAGLPGRRAEMRDLTMAEAALLHARTAMGREMVPGVADLLAGNLEHSRWDHVAARCLSCANCTMVCPTCFCSTVEDTTDLAGTTTVRERRWDSCFTLDFSYIHGGSIRRETRSRYRQWITHKLSTWHAQFGTSGCTGCGRCITWCPVGIDITEEARAIRDGGPSGGGGHTSRKEG
ncbi:4Fe-4S dicluster domain-containing protein [Azospirillum halopraeferens]|uniref:4Fe-4S dicluster domain-containing protein n=1 Tax=Azospirillum halopraeferens TaxID=34010 RepID=UPI00041B2815|nr:4Fe-4S dicluster domain-containing protein [Azospirillum halopraeferens]